MPNDMMRLDTAFPDLTGKTDSEKINTILDYLYMLAEQLRYTLGNLGVENMNTAALEELSQIVTEPVRAHLEDAAQQTAQLTLAAEGMNLRLTNAEGNVAAVTDTADALSRRINDFKGWGSTLEQTVDSLTLQVENGEDTAVVKLLAGDVQLGATGTIRFTGDVVFAGDLTDGVTRISGDNIRSGTITGVTLISRDNTDDSDGKVVQVRDGKVSFLRQTGSESTEYGALYYDAAAPYIYLTTSSGAPLKLLSRGNMSIDAIGEDYTGELFIGCSSLEDDAGVSHTSAQWLHLGNDRSRTEMFGDIQIRTTTTAESAAALAGEKRWQFGSDGKIYFNGEVYTP